MPQQQSNCWLRYRGKWKSNIRLPGSEAVKSETSPIEYSTRLCRITFLSTSWFVLALRLLPQPFQAADGPDAYVERALRYYQEQLYEQARGQLETSLKLYADHPGSHALLGLVLDMQGDRNNARFHLEKSLELIPHNSTYRLNL